MRRVEARMQDRKLEEATGPEDSDDFPQHDLQLWNVVQAHESGDEIEDPVGERKVDRAGGDVADAQRGARLLGFGVPDEGRSDVEPGHQGTLPREHARVVSLPAAKVESRETGDRGE